MEIIHETAFFITLFYSTISTFSQILSALYDYL